MENTEIGEDPNEVQQQIQQPEKMSNRNKN